MPQTLLFFILLNILLAGPIPKQLAKKWELSGVQIAKNFISAEELKRKNANLTMQIFQDGRCIIKANNPQAIAKENRCFLEETENAKFLIIEAENELGGKVKSRFKIEEITNKKLVLSLGEAQDKEVYYYKAVK